jgi:hypothetical protein
MNYCASKGIYVIYSIYLPDAGTIQRRENVAELDRNGLPQKNFELALLQVAISIHRPPFNIYTYKYMIVSIVT